MNKTIISLFSLAILLFTAEILYLNHQLKDVAQLSSAVYWVCNVKK